MKKLDKKYKKIRFQKGMTHSKLFQGHPEYSRGMSYVELIVVLSIFSAMTSVVLFNYGLFQGKVDVKNLASDIALKIVEAQKSSLSGTLPVQITAPTWKPSYGVYFDITTPKQFTYFVDLNNANGYEAGEAVATIDITKSNYIDGINRCIGDTCVPSSSISPLSITFKRPDSSAVFKNSSGITLPNDFDYIQIIVKSPKTSTAIIKVYPSGRIQVQ